MSKGVRKIARVDESEIDENYVKNYKMCPAKVKAIYLIYNLRALRSMQIARIMGCNRKYTLSILKDLYYHRFLDRRFPYEEKGNGSGSAQGIYFLDEAGKIFISGYMDIFLKDVQWRPIDNLIKYEKLRHTLDSAEIVTRVFEECRNAKYSVVDYKTEKKLWTEYTYKNNAFEFAPDIFFKILKDRHTYSFFVENDEATMSVNSFLAKVPKYDNYKISGQYIMDYDGVFPRVLVITTSKDRAIVLADEVGKKQGSKVDFLFTWHDMFYESPFGSKTFIHTSVKRAPKTFSMFDEIPEDHRAGIPDPE